MRKCHLVVEAALKEGVALQELHLEEIREGLVWLCTNVGLVCFPVHYLSCLACFPVHRWINLVVHRCDFPNFMSLLACKTLDGG